MMTTLLLKTTLMMPGSTTTNETWTMIEIGSLLRITHIQIIIVSFVDMRAEE